MFTEKQLLFWYTITPVHMGAGTALGVIDNPIQREVHSNHPVFAGSGLKGALRHAALGQGKDGSWVDRVFGPPPAPGKEDAHAGAISLSDAQLVALPVRSLREGFVWVTSPYALERLRRLSATAQVDGVPGDEIPVVDADKMEAVVLDEKLLTKCQGADRLVLETYMYEPVSAGQDGLRTWAAWLANHAVPQGNSNSFFREKMKSHLVLLSDTQFSFFAENAMVIEPHVRIDDETGTASEGGLFFTENLPPETLMVSLLMASDERRGKGAGSDGVLSAREVLDGVRETFDANVVQIGGDATTGRGQVQLQFA